MTDLTPIIDELDRLEREATPGPWHYRAGEHKHYVGTVDDDFGIALQEMHWRDGRDVPAAANAQIIATLRNHARELIDGIRERDAEIARLRAFLQAELDRLRPFTERTHFVGAWCEHPACVAYRRIAAVLNDEWEARDV